METSYRLPVATEMLNREGGIHQRQSCRTPRDPALPIHSKSHQQQYRMGTVSDSVSDGRDDARLFPRMVQAGIQQEIVARIYKPCQSHVNNRRWANKRCQLFEATSRYP